MPDVNEGRVSRLEEQVRDHETRIRTTENRQRAYDTALSILRWAGPVAVGIAGLIVGKLL